MLPLRLIKGLLKGIVIGGLLGYGVAAAGMGLPAAWLAYPLAAVVGVVAMRVPSRAGQRFAKRAVHGVWSRRLSFRSRSVRSRFLR